MKGIEIADRKIKIRTEIESYLKSFNVYLDDMDKFENKQMMKKKLLVKNTWYVWLINYIFERIKKGGWVLKENLCVFLKETQPRIIVNQRILAICVELERN